jgi:nucleotide-binding universal stress UspA family protein
LTTVSRHVLPPEDAAGNSAGPVLLCAGSDSGVATRLARQAACLLIGRRAIVLAAWQLLKAYGPIEADAAGSLGFHDEFDALAARRASEASAAACSELSGRGCQASPFVVRDERHAWEVALELAEREEASLIVIGSSDENEPRPGSLGSQARALAHRTRSPLLVVPDSDLGIADDAAAVFAFDGSRSASVAVSVSARALTPRPASVTTVWHSVLAAAPAARVALPARVVEGGAARLDDESRTAAETTAAEGATLLEAAGWSASAHAIVNRDGIPDLGLGSYTRPADDSYDHSAFVVFGRRTTSTIALDDLGRGGFRLTGPPAMPLCGAHGVGAALAAGGDLDADGRPDLLVGAPALGDCAGQALLVPATPGAP